MLKVDRQGGGEIFQLMFYCNVDFFRFLSKFVNSTSSKSCPLGCFKIDREDGSRIIKLITFYYKNNFTFTSIMEGKNA